MATYNFPKESIDLIKFTYECINNGNNSKDLLNTLFDKLVEKSF